MKSFSAVLISAGNLLFVCREQCWHSNLLLLGNLLETSSKMMQDEFIEPAPNRKLENDH